VESRSVWNSGFSSARRPRLSRSLRCVLFEEVSLRDCADGAPVRRACTRSCSSSMLGEVVSQCGVV